MSVYDTGVRPHITEYLRKKSEEVRDYGDYWSASSAGYCMRLQIMRRLGVPKVPELAEDQDRTTRVFEVGHIFHKWVQDITKDKGVSVAQEVELQDEDIMVRGHFDDLIRIDYNENGEPVTYGEESRATKYILYDYKTAHSGAFKWKKDKPIGDYHRMQLGTYLYMLHKSNTGAAEGAKDVEEARILTISKDDLRMDEKTLHWDAQLEKDVVNYWRTLNGYWKNKKLPKCTCDTMDGGFMAKRTAKGKVYGDFYWNETPCSIEWARKHRELFEGWTYEREA